MWFYFVLGAGLVGAVLVLRWLDKFDGINRSRDIANALRNTNYIDNTPEKKQK